MPWYSSDIERGKDVGISGEVGAGRLDRRGLEGGPIACADCAITVGFSVRTVLLHYI